MKPITNQRSEVENKKDKVDIALDTLLENVTDKLNKLKNKDYLFDYLIKSGLSIDLANKMIHPQNSKHATK